MCVHSKLVGRRIEPSCTCLPTALYLWVLPGLMKRPARSAMPPNAVRCGSADIQNSERVLYIFAVLTTSRPRDCDSRSPTSTPSSSTLLALAALRRYKRCQRALRDVVTAHSTSMAVKPVAFGLLFSRLCAAAGPFFQTLNGSWVIGNDLWNITQGRVYGKPAYYKGRDIIGEAVGHYVGYSAAPPFLAHSSRTVVTDIWNRWRNQPQLRLR